MTQPITKVESTFVKSFTLKEEWAIQQIINEESLKGAGSQSQTADRCQQVMKVNSRQKLKYRTWIR
jgi:Asp-tRNA(Asn)/Glu-tRNA(Gln) amidotransferase B subunit